MSDESPNVEPLYPDRLTWAVLLGRWVDFARQAVGLPDDAAGRRLRDSVPDIIMLQAVWFALDELEDLPADEQALGVDRAGVLIDRHRGAIADRWPEAKWPATLRELVADVEQRWREQTAPPE